VTRARAASTGRLVGETGRIDSPRLVGFERIAGRELIPGESELCLRVLGHGSVTEQVVHRLCDGSVSPQTGRLVGTARRQSYQDAAVGGGRHASA
jgi:hypothetical protein